MEKMNIQKLNYLKYLSSGQKSYDWSINLFILIIQYTWTQCDVIFADLVNWTTKQKVHSNSLPNDIQNDYLNKTCCGVGKYLTYKLSLEKWSNSFLCPTKGKHRNYEFVETDLKPKKKKNYFVWPILLSDKVLWLNSDPFWRNLYIK